MKQILVVPDALVQLEIPFGGQGNEVYMTRKEVQKLNTSCIEHYTIPIKF